MPWHGSALAAASVLTLAGCAGGGGHVRAAAPAPPAAGYGARDIAPVGDTGEGPRGSSQQSSGAERYDEVGYASWYGDEVAGQPTASGHAFDPNGISAAHRSLPVGSFAEVTALDTGRTILVIITDRGPGARDRIIDLSRGAARLLAISSAPVAAVRVRRITPSPQDQAALRRGLPASPRMEAPPVLLSVLRRKLPARSAAAAIRPVAGTARPARAAGPAHTSPERPGVARTRGFFIQVAAFSSEARARALADRLSLGRVQPAGVLWRVQAGPFADVNSAQRARDGIARQGYGDARIVRIP